MPDRLYVETAFGSFGVGTLLRKTERRATTTCSATSIRSGPRRSHTYRDQSSWFDTSYDGYHGGGHYHRSSSHSSAPTFAHPSSYCPQYQPQSASPETFPFVPPPSYSAFSGCSQPDPGPQHSSSSRRQRFRRPGQLDFIFTTEGIRGAYELLQKREDACRSFYARHGAEFGDSPTSLNTARKTLPFLDQDTTMDSLEWLARVAQAWSDTLDKKATELGQYLHKTQNQYTVDGFEVG